MKKTWMYVFLIILLGFGIYYYFDSTSCAKYSCITFLGKERFSLVEEYESSSDAYRAMLRDGNTRIRIEAYPRISKDEATSHDKIKVMNIESMYETAKSPYPGALSNEIECGTEYRPDIEKITANALHMTHVRGYLNERFQLGSCIKEEIKYKSHLVLFHCDSHKKWYQFEIIAPLDEKGQDRQIIDSIMCR